MMSVRPQISTVSTSQLTNYERTTGKEPDSMCEEAQNGIRQH